MSIPLSADTYQMRKSNFELLRIVAMLMIIAHHFSVHSDFQLSMFKINRVYVDFVGIGGKIGNDIFILISGYFMIKVKEFKANKVLKLWLQLVTYSISLFVLSYMFDFAYYNNHLSVSFPLSGLSKISLKQFILHSFPIAFNEWGFASLYFVLFLLSPFINKALINMSKKEYERMLYLILFMWCVVPSITQGLVLYGSNKLLWFITVYCVGGYIRLYAKKTNISGLAYILSSISFSILWFAVLHIKIPANSFLSVFNYLMVGFNANMYLPTFLAAVLLFVGFMKIDIGTNRFINTVASTTFGIYLIHDNDFIRPFLWKTLLVSSKYSYSRLFIPYSIVSIAAVFIVCSLLEMFRKQLLEKFYIRKIDRFLEYMRNKSFFEPIKK